MSKKDRATGSRQRGNIAQKKRLLTPLRISIGLAVIVVGIVLAINYASRNKIGAIPSEEQTRVPILPPASPETKVPINDVDPVTGKPIVPTSPTLSYKGYTIAFCCTYSEGYTGGWARMSEAEKDAFVRRYLK